MEKNYLESTKFCISNPIFLKLKIQGKASGLDQGPLYHHVS